MGGDGAAGIELLRLGDESTGGGGPGGGRGGIPFV